MTTDADERQLDTDAAPARPEGAPETPAAEAPPAEAEAPGQESAPEPVIATEAPAPGAPEPERPPAPTEPGPVAETPVAEAPAEGDAAPTADAKAPKPKGKAKPRRRRDRRPPVPDLPKTRAPLPLDELRDASRSTLELFGRQGVRDAFVILAPRERQDISNLISQDDDHRPRARNIANGSLGAGRIDKAMAATIISMAQLEDLWSVTLDKEQAAQKLGRIRAAKQRDQRKAERAKERENRADRVSREDMEKARDGSVGATIRIVTDGDKRDRRKKPKDEPPKKRGSVLDELGY